MKTKSESSPTTVICSIGRGVWQVVGTSLLITDDYITDENDVALFSLSGELCGLILTGDFDTIMREASDLVRLGTFNN